jgi:acetyl esterase/lipase
LAEQQTLNLLVEGSIPSGLTKPHRDKKLQQFAESPDFEETSKVGALPRSFFIDRGLGLESRTRFRALPIKRIGAMSMALVVTVNLSAAQRASSPTPKTVREYLNLTYATANGSPREMDLYVPSASAAAVPFIIFVNCGGGGGLPRAGFKSHATYLAERGIAAATTSCLAAPAAGAEGINDIYAAIKFLRTRAAEYHLDVRHIAVGGASAGGALSMLTGANLWDGSAWTRTPSELRVQAVVAYNPGLQRGAAHVSSEMASTLFLCGTEDVSYPQYAELLDRLHGLHVRAELFTAEGVGHGGVNNPPWLDKGLARVADFLISVFKQ